MLPSSWPSPSLAPSIRRLAISVSTFLWSKRHLRARHPIKLEPACFLATVLLELCPSPQALSPLVFPISWSPRKGQDHGHANDVVHLRGPRIGRRRLLWAAPTDIRREQGTRKTDGFGPVAADDLQIGGSFQPRLIRRGLHGPVSLSLVVVQAI